VRVSPLSSKKTGPHLWRLYSFLWAILGGMVRSVGVLGRVLRWWPLGVIGCGCGGFGPVCRMFGVLHFRHGRRGIVNLVWPSGCWDAAVDPGWGGAGLVGNETPS
jgi:hypothetical protein